MSYSIILKDHYNDDRIPKAFGNFFSLESYSVKNLKFCITSGEQRDLKNNTIFEPSKNLLKILYTIKNNPRNKEQKEIGKYISDYFVNSNNIDIKSVLQSINSQLKEINDKKITNHDFLGKDYFFFFCNRGNILW